MVSPGSGLASGNEALLIRFTVPFRPMEGDGLPPSIMVCFLFERNLGRETLTLKHEPPSADNG